MSTRYLVAENPMRVVSVDVDMETEGEGEGKRYYFTINGSTARFGPFTYDPYPHETPKAAIQAYLEASKEQRDHLQKKIDWWNIGIEWAEKELANEKG
jgi:hypothetical protein